MLQPLTYHQLDQLPIDQQIRMVAHELPMYVIVCDAIVVAAAFLIFVVVGLGELDGCVTVGRNLGR